MNYGTTDKSVYEAAMDKYVVVYLAGGAQMTGKLVQHGARWTVLETYDNKTIVCRDGLSDGYMNVTRTWRENIRTDAIEAITFEASA